MQKLFIECFSYSHSVVRPKKVTCLLATLTATVLPQAHKQISGDCSLVIPRVIHSQTIRSNILYPVVPQAEIDLYIALV